LLLFALAVFTAAALVSDRAQSQEERLVSAAATLLGWLDPLWRAVYASLIGFALLVAVACFAGRRWRICRDLVIALTATYLIGYPVGRSVRDEWPSLTEKLWATLGQYPALRLAGAVAVLAVAAPELTRTARVLAAWLVGLSSVAVVVIGVAYPSSVLGGLALGSAVASLVRLAFGSSAGFPGAARVATSLQELGIDARGLAVATRQRAGAATYVATDPGGRALEVIVLGRDAQDAQRLANVWRNLAYRDSGPAPATGRLHQVEHESLITLLAQRSGACVPAVLVAGVATSGDALFVTQCPTQPSVEEAGVEVTDAFLVHLWEQVARLRESRVSHGGLNLDSVLDTVDGPMIVHFQRGKAAASPSALATDVAELLVATSIATDPERALAAALSVVGPQAIAAALPYVQRAALTPHLRDLARDHEVRLAALRKQAAAATGVTLPEIAPLQRIRLRDVLLMGAVAFAAYLLITQLEQIGFATIVNELSKAQWPWVVVALVIAQTTFITQAVSVRGAVPSPLPLRPCVVLESAIKFVNLTVPSSAGRIALNIRFLQKLGVPTGEAIASGAVDGVSDTIVQIVLVLLVLPFVDLSVSVPSGGTGEPPWHLIVAVVLIALVGAAIVMFVARLRSKVLPLIRQGFVTLKTVASSRNKLFQLFGGNVATQVLFALVLGASCQAYGIHVSLPDLLIVNMGASVFASIMPVPGGIGVAEAGLTAGLTAVGVPESVAFAAALTHRLCTFYLPPIWGYFSLRWLARKGYV
jgi:uncharacterized membrane protein YbhN (UPF0104 family)